MRGISDQCLNFDQYWSAIGICPGSPGVYKDMYHTHTGLAHHL